MPTHSGATDVHSAAAQLSSLIQSEQSLPTDEEREEVQEEQAEEQEAAPEAEEGEPETPEEAEAESADTEEEPEKYKVKVDGEELEVTLEELQKGYMMEANYRNKTTSLNKEREAIEKKAAEVDEQLSEAKSLIESEMQALDSPEMQELKETDPDEYIRKYEGMQKKVQKFEQLQKKRAEEHQARQEKLVQKERELLFDAFPEWKGDQQRMAKESAELMDVMSSLGFTQDELNGITDHRLFVLAHKAQQLDKIQKANLESKKVQAKPKTTKPGTPKTNADRQSEKLKKKWAQLKQTGSKHAALDILSGNY